MMQGTWTRVERPGAVDTPSREARAALLMRPGFDSYRRTLSAGPLALIEDGSVPPELSPSGYCPDLQVILTYEGLFAYFVGSRRLLVDSNQIFLVGGDEEWRDEHPLEHVGHAAIVITPSPRLVEDVRDLTCFGHGHRYESATLLASAAARFGGQRLLAGVERDLGEDEAVIGIVREALRANGKVLHSPRHVSRAKELLHACAGERLRLDEIAGEIGLSPIYLTQLFSQAEGLPLYQYELQLRLNRALRELRSSDDITALALELGFSSHSHFSATFRSTFGMTPSQYRGEMSPRTALSGRPSRTNH